MPKKTFALIAAVLLLCILKFLGVEVQQGQAVAASKNVSQTLTQDSKRASTLEKSAIRKDVPTGSTTPQKMAEEEHIPPRRITKPEAYCRLLAAGVDLESIELKLSHYGNELAESGEVYLTAFVQTPSCPLHTYSRYDLDKDNRILNFTDCHGSTREDMVLTNGLQGKITYLGPAKNRVNIAISGSGLFVLQCGDEIRYSRSGEWHLTPDGTLATKPENCQVLDRQGRLFHLDTESDLSEHGCNSQGECLAVVQPESGAFRVRDRHTLLATDDPIKALLPESDHTKMFVNYLEDLHDIESGLLGPDFESLPYLSKPPWCPESFN